MPRISHFDIPVDNPERAQKFYSKVFDWKFEKWDGPVDYWMAKTGTEQPGIDGGMSKRIPGQMGMSNTINVPSVDEFAKKITENGSSFGEILRNEEQVEKPKSREMKTMEKTIK